MKKKSKPIVKKPVDELSQASLNINELTAIAGNQADSIRTINDSIKILSKRVTDLSEVVTDLRRQKLHLISNFNELSKKVKQIAGRMGV